MPLLANADAREITTAEACRAELVEHLTAGVDWVAAVQRMAADGVTTFVEVGPGSVLTGLIKRIAPDAETIVADDPATRDDCSTSPPRLTRRTRPEGAPLRRPDYDRRVVVTGLGVISPVGNDVATAWANLTEGHSGLGPITRFDPSPYEAKLAGEVHDFTASEWMDAKAVRRSESSMHFGVAAAKQALADSGFELTDENRTEVGVIFGSGAGGQAMMIDNYIDAPRARTADGRADVDRERAGRQLLGDDRDRDRGDRPQRVHGLGVRHRDPQHRRGAEAIRRGDCIAVISGSTEAPLLEVGHAGFSNMRGMGLPRPGEGPQTVSRPFDLTRDGFVLGEGAGSLFLEDLELAKARGATIYAEVVGYGSAADGWDMVQPIEAGHRLGARDEDGARAPRRAGRRGRPDQPARDLDPARRQARGRGDLGGLRRRAVGRPRSRSRSAPRSR